MNMNAGIICFERTKQWYSSNLNKTIKPTFVYFINNNMFKFNFS